VRSSARAIAAALVSVAPTWDYLGEGRVPATLADCPLRTVATISYSSGGRPVAAWRRFCYFGSTTTRKE
jgi:hypothetical protein